MILRRPLTDPMAVARFVVAPFYQSKKATFFCCFTSVFWFSQFDVRPTAGRSGYLDMLMVSNSPSSFFFAPYLASFSLLRALVGGSTITGKGWYNSLVYCLSLPWCKILDINDLWLVSFFYIPMFGWQLDPGLLFLYLQTSAIVLSCSKRLEVGLGSEVYNDWLIDWSIGRLQCQCWLGTV